MGRSGRGLAERCAVGTVLGFAQAVIWETMLWVQRETGSDFAGSYLSLRLSFSLALSLSRSLSDFDSLCLSFSLARVRSL